MNDDEAGSDDGRWLTPGVAAVSSASFFSDAGHEIVTSVLPGFITGVLHGSAASLGVIEGISDALTGAAKLIGGPLANEPRRRRRMATGGYIATAIATALIGVATAVWQVGLLRGIAWASRGIRSPSRDAMLSSIASPRSYGKSFGLERAGDNLGAVAGPLLAAWLVAAVGIRPTIWLAFIPGLFAAIAIGFAANEARKRPPGERRGRLRLGLGELRREGMFPPLLPIVFFECGNLATTLLILRATQVLEVRGVAGAVSIAILWYAVHNAVAAVVALAGGAWIDRSGPVLVFATGAALYVLAYLGFGLAWGPVWGVAVAFALAGAGIGLAETAESALVAKVLPDHLRGSGYGVVGAVQSAGNIVGTLVAGVLYTTVGPLAAFGYAAAWMGASLAASGWLKVRRGR